MNLSKHIETGFREPVSIKYFRTTGHVDGDLRQIVHEDVLAEIERIKGGYECIYARNETTYHIFLYGIPNQKARKFARYIVSWLYTIHAAFGARPCSPIQEFHLYLSVKNKKEMPDVDRATVGEHHVNSAFTYRCNRNPVNRCFIYRSEEWFKVFLHESIHAVGLDFSSSSSVNVLQNCFPIHNETGDMRIEESYVETWAELIYLIYWCRTSQQSYAEALHIERRFSMYQVAKLIRHFGMDVNTMDWTRWKESSSVFSYYFARMLTLNDPNFAKRWPLPYGNKTGYEEYVCDLYRRNFLTNSPQSFQKEIAAFCRLNPPEKTTARMVIHDIAELVI